MRSPGASDLEKVATEANLPVTVLPMDVARGNAARAASSMSRRSPGNPEKPEASPTVVSEMIRYIIENDDRRLRFPVGPDALSFLGWRSALSDEDWIGLGGLERDGDHFQGVFMDSGVDLRSG
jgi:hypothetical protein